MNTNVKTNTTLYVHAQPYHAFLTIGKVDEPYAVLKFGTFNRNFNGKNARQFLETLEELFGLSLDAGAVSLPIVLPFTTVTPKIWLPGAVVPETAGARLARRSGQTSGIYGEMRRSCLSRVGRPGTIPPRGSINGESQNRRGCCAQEFCQ